MAEDTEIEEYETETNGEGGGPMHQSPPINTMKAILEREMNAFVKENPASADKTTAAPKTTAAKVNTTEDPPANKVATGPNIAVPEFGKAPEAKTADASSEEANEPLPETIKGKAGEEFKKIRSRAHTAEQEAKRIKGLLATRDQELAALKSTPATKTDFAELETTKAELAKYQKELEAIALERSPRFSEHYRKEGEKHISLAKSVAPSEHSEELDKLLRQPRSVQRNERLKEISESMDEMDSQVLKRAVADLQVLDIQKQTELANAPKLRQQLAEVERNEQEQSKSELRTRQEAAVKTVLDQARALDSFRQVEGDEAHNQAVKQNEDFISRFITGQLPEQEALRVPVWAKEGIRLHTEVVPVLMEKITRLEAKLKEYNGATPNITGHGKAEGEGKAGGQPKTFKERFQEEWRGPG